MLGGMALTLMIRFGMQDEMSNPFYRVEWGQCLTHCMCIVVRLPAQALVITYHKSLLKSLKSQSKFEGKILGQGINAQTAFISIWHPTGCIPWHGMIVHPSGTRNVILEVRPWLPTLEVQAYNCNHDVFALIMSSLKPLHLLSTYYAHACSTHTP